jgi:hypothetical protein
MLIWVWVQLEIAMWLESMLDNERQVLGPEKGTKHRGGYAN